MKDSLRPPTRGKSVRDDWRAWLPDAKAQVFNKEVQRLESSYVMLSVSLNEALELRHHGQPGKSLQAVGMTSGLCRLLTNTWWLAPGFVRTRQTLRHDSERRASRSRQFSGS